MAFNGAHDFTIGTSNINVYQNYRTPSPAEILHHAQAIEALHTSATVGYISKCHPGTREKVTADIVDWVVGATGADDGSAPRKSMLWFSGPAGAGKTSIMRGVVDRCVVRGFSTLSFFFSVRGSGVTSVRHFIGTIVHQLIALDPVLEPIIYEAVRRRPTIFKESLEFQMERLLAEPLESPAFLWRPWPPKIVIAIDGLDECREEREREHILNLLHSLITRLPYLIVVVIASRPEFDLRRAFARPKLHGIAKSIKLHDYNGSDDIRAFVCDELEDIRRSHPLAGLIPQGWMFEEFVQLLVDKSSGNFIVPVTAMKYVKHSRRNPVDSLNIILGLLMNPLPTSKPFAELDALYAHILHPPDTDLSLMKRILHCTIALTELDNQFYLTPTFFDEFLELSPGMTATALCDLHCIVDIPDSEDEPIKFHHKSLQDYLLDRERSSDLFQSLYKTHLDLATRCATHLTRWGSNPVVTDLDCILYSARKWQRHLDFCITRKPVSAILPKVIMDLDPRISAIYSFIHGLDIDGFYGNRLHAVLCSEQHCLRLCRLVTHVAKCVRKCESFRKAFSLHDVKGKLNALSRFKSETGLFAPLDPDGCEDDEDEDDEDDNDGDDDDEDEDEDDEDDDDGDDDDEDDDEGEDAEGEDIHPEAGSSTLLLPPVIDLVANTTGGPAGGSGGSARSLAKTASSMEVQDIATVSKKRPHDRVEANLKKKRKLGNRDANPVT